MGDPPTTCSQKFWRLADRFTGWLVNILTDAVPHPLASLHGMASGLMFAQAAVTAIMTALFGNRFGQAIEFKRTHLFTMPVSPLVPCFMGVAGVGHFLAMRSGLFKRITQHKGWARWAEKSISVGLMYGMVALLCDKEAAVPLLWLILLNACSMGIRLVMERDVEHKLFGHGRYSKNHPERISSKNPLGNLVGLIEQRLAPVNPPGDDGEEEDEDPNAKLIEVVPDSNPVPRAAVPSDWEVITSSIIMDAIALAMFLPYYIDDAKNEKWFVHASVATLIVTVFGYTGLLILYRRAALKLQAEGQDQLTKEDPPDDDEKEKWDKQKPVALVRTRLDALYETLERRLIIWSILTTSGLGWLVMIGVIQDRQ